MEWYSDTGLRRSLPTREEVWLRAWCAAIQVIQEHATEATEFADECLMAFDARFTQKEAEEA